VRYFELHQGLVILAFRPAERTHGACGKLGPLYISDMASVQTSVCEFRFCRGLGTSKIKHETDFRNLSPLAMGCSVRVAVLLEYFDLLYNAAKRIQSTPSLLSGPEIVQISKAHSFIIYELQNYLHMYVTKTVSSVLIFEGIVNTHLY